MDEQQEQAANDAWQTAFHEAVYRFSMALQDFHRTNPWPEIGVIRSAINMLATELWDRCFTLAEISSALTDAAADLPRYTAGEEVRP